MQSIGGVSPNLLRVLARLSPDLVTELFAAGKVLDAEVISVFQDRAMLSFGKGVRLEVALQAALKEGEQVNVQVQPREQGGALVLRLVQGTPEKGGEQVARPTATRAWGEPQAQTSSRLQPQAPLRAQPQAEGLRPGRAPTEPEPAPQSSLRPEPPARRSALMSATAVGRTETEEPIQSAPQRSSRPLLGPDGRADGRALAAALRQSPLPAEGSDGVSLPPAEARPGTSPADPAAPSAKAPGQPAAQQPTSVTLAVRTEPAAHLPEHLADPGSPRLTPPDMIGDKPLPARADAVPGPALAEGEPPVQATGRPDSAPQTVAQLQPRLAAESPQPVLQVPITQVRGEVGQPPLIWIPIPLANGKQGWAQLQVQEGDAPGGQKDRVQHQVRLWWETPHLGQVQVTLDASHQSLTALFTVLLAQVRRGLEQGLADLQTRLAAAGFDDVKVGCRQALPREPMGPVVATDSNSRLDHRL